MRLSVYTFRAYIFWLFSILTLFAGQPAYAQESAIKEEWLNPEPFGKWLEEFRGEAVSQGVSAQVVNGALADFEPVEKVIILDRKQPENTITLEEYIKRTVTPARIKNGRNELSENKELLRSIAEKYSVPANVIVALWGMETSYGENSGSYNTVYSLATLAYDGRRSGFFRKELINSLKIMEAEKIPLESFLGSWAGAFGQCQFMPSSYLKYAVDFDGDGKRDIWFSQADIFASIANYLHSEGWNPDEEIEENNNNYKVLLKWNRSRYFATAVSKLANAIGG
jgi:membrane-bound lytic murein transglycosylase B